jgi:hypothetical protein
VAGRGAERGAAGSPAQILAAAPHVLRPGASVWLEVDESHPELLEQLFASGGGGAARVPGVALAEWRRDMFGRPRFVHFRVAGEGGSAGG